MTTATTTRPRLAEIPLASVWPPRKDVGRVYCTMSEGQWDGLLAGAYDSGCVLLELDDAENILRAFRTAAMN